MNAVQQYLDEIFQEYPLDDPAISSIKAQAARELEQFCEKEAASGTPPEKINIHMREYFGRSEYISYHLMQQQIQNAYQNFMDNYKKRIRTGIACIFIIPLIFLILMFSQDSKLVFLSLWIVSILVIAAYLIFMEYLKERWKKIMDWEQGENK